MNTLKKRLQRCLRSTSGSLVAWAVFMLLLVFLAGCSSTTEEVSPTDNQTPTQAAPTAPTEEKLEPTQPRPYPSLKAWAETLGKNPRFVCCLDYAPQELEF